MASQRHTHTHTHKHAMYEDDIPQKTCRWCKWSRTNDHANTPTEDELLLHNLEEGARGISLYLNARKTYSMSFIQNGAMFMLNGKPLKLEQFPYVGSDISSTDLVSAYV